MLRWMTLAVIMAVAAPQGADREGVLAKIAALARISLTPNGPVVADQIRSGLVDPSPAVRAAAARVTHVGAITALLPSLRDALRNETDGDAAREMTWALADLDDTNASDPMIAAAATRPPLSSEVVEGLLAGRGLRAASHWKDLQTAIGADPGVVARGLELGLQAEATSVFASMALRDGQEDVLIGLSSRSGLDASVLIAALSSRSTRTRSVAYFQLAARGTVAASKSLAERQPPDSLEERVAIHLFERAQGLAPSESMGDLARALGGIDESTRRVIRSRLFSTRGATRGLVPKDHEALLRALAADKDDVPRALHTPAPALAGGGGRGVAAEAAPIKTFGGYPPLFVAAVLADTKCKGAPSNFSAVEVSYRPGGRAARVTPYASSKELPGCSEAALILAVTSHPSDGDQATIRILPLHPDHLSCLSGATFAPTPPSANVWRVGGGIKEPRKVRSVAPIYPDVAVGQRQEGVVVIEALLSESGCVSRMRVVNEVWPPLDLSALTAVSAWKYTPTLVDGVPVPVVMTVTVNFRLR